MIFILSKWLTNICPSWCLDLLLLHPCMNTPLNFRLISIKAITNLNVLLVKMQITTTHAISILKIKLGMMLEKLLESVSVSLLLSLLVFAAAAALVSSALLKWCQTPVMMTISNNKLMLSMSREEDTVDKKPSLLRTTVDTECFPHIVWYN